MISAFGPRAEQFAAALGDMEAVVAEPARLFYAYVEAVRRRTLGESFYGMLMIDDNRDRTMTTLAPAVLRDVPDSDERRAVLRSVASGSITVNEKSGQELLTEPDVSDPGMRGAAGEFLSLCPALLVRSLTEYNRVSKLVRRARPYELAVVEPLVPVVERRVTGRPGIVIWAPERDALSVSLHAFALTEIHANITLVSADGIVPPGLDITTYRAGDPRIDAALAIATCIVVTDPTDPGGAVAFARQGYGIVAPVSSGTHEFVRNAYLYDPTAPRSLHVAAMTSLGQPASLGRLPAAPPRAPSQPALPVAAVEAPPATIVVPTFNRRGDLERCLQCIGEQTYPNVRAVVVNDAGEAVDDIVARFPFARLLHLEKNGGVVPACMAGLALVTDGFVQFLADDDALFPDHVDRLVTAMLRSGAAVGHANVLIRYVDRLEGGALKTTGYNAAVFIDTATPTETMVSTPIAGHALMFRRTLFDEIGGWREDCDLADQEIQMRAGKRYVFAYVDQVTAEWRIHGSNFSGKVNPGVEQRRIYEELHPVSDRPHVSQMREQVLAAIAARPPGFVFQPTILVVKS